MERLQASRWPVAVGAGLGLAALVLPWLTGAGVSVGLWGPSAHAEQAAARTVSGLLVLALLVLGLRLGSRSWSHHAKAWRREVGLAGGLLVAAAVLGLCLPVSGPCLPGAQCGALVSVSLGAGWYAAVGAAVAVLAGRWMAREPPGAAAAMALLRGGPARTAVPGEADPGRDGEASEVPQGEPRGTVP